MGASTSIRLQLLLLRRAAALASAAAATTTATASTLLASSSARASVSAPRARAGILGAFPTPALRQYHALGPSDDEQEQQHRHRRRALSTTSVAADATDANAGSATPEQQQQPQQQPAEDVVVYRGALGPSLRRLKLVSLANTAVAIAASPTLSWLADAAPDGTTAASYARAATVAATAAGFGVLTTLGLHWFTKPYVHEIVRVVGADDASPSGGEGKGGAAAPTHPRYRLRALSPLGRAAWRPLDVAGVRPADVARPLATFVEGGRVYYVDAAGFAEGEDALREALTPLSAAEAAAVAAAAAAEAQAQQQQQQAAGAVEAAQGSPSARQEQQHSPAEGEGRR